MDQREVTGERSTKDTQCKDPRHLIEARRGEALTVLEIVVSHPGSCTARRIVF